MTEIISEKAKTYDLEERTTKFAEEVILFVKKLPNNLRFIDIIRQLIRAATSIGANYCEADDASTKKDFVYKIGTCRRESKETKHWIRMITTAVSSLEAEAKHLLVEAQELNLIFSSIVNRILKQ